MAGKNEESALVVDHKLDKSHNLLERDRQPTEKGNEAGARADGEVDRLGRHAETLGMAQDYAAAGKLYEQLLDRPLPRWQHARLLYNLGTLALMQRQPDKALRLFAQLVPTDLSLPRFGRDWLLNSGIASLQYGRGLADRWQEDALDLQTLFALQAMRLFSMAQQLDQQVWEEEGGNPSPLSTASQQIDSWLTAARSQLLQLEQQRRNFWSEGAPLVDLTKEAPDLRLDLLALLDQVEAPIEGEASSLALLQRARQYALRASHASLLLSELETRSEIGEEIKKRLQQQQASVIEAAGPFIPALLNEQESFFRELPEPALACQRFPWEQVVPLFAQGLKSARYAQKELQNTPLDYPSLLAAQARTAASWREAADLMQTPPRSPSSPLPQAINQTLGLIQEMYLEDQFQPAPADQELHAW